jgi:hypothetical protein
VSQEGGVPLGSQRWEGKTSDTQIFQEWAEALRAAVARAPTPRYLVADATRSTEDTAATLAQRGFLTRMPGPLTLVSQVITQALQWDRGYRLDAMTRYDRLALWHDGMAQRWLVVASQAAMERAEANLNTAQQRAWAALEPPLLPWHATRCETPEAAPAALTALSTAGREQQLAGVELLDHNRSACQGRPTPTRPRKAIAGQRHAQVRPAQEVLEAHQPQSACCVIGTNRQARHVRDAEVLRASKAQAGVEDGVRLLKAPVFFVSSLCVKKPSRMQGLLLVMTLALLVYSLTQRRLRPQGAERHATIPNHIHQPPARPTLRWVFQRLEGLHRVRVLVQGQDHDLREGLNEVQIKILRLFGDAVCRLYQISPG